MTAIYKKELRILSCSLTGYVFSAVFLLSFGGFFVIYNVINAQNSFSSAVSVVTLPMLVLIPILTMRSFAEERHQKSDMLLYSLPVDMWQVTLGKFFSMVTWMLIPYAVVCLYPLGLSTLGEINFISTYAMLAAFFVLLCCMVSIGIFISALTDSQMVAAALSFLFFLMLYVLPLLSGGDLHLGAGLACSFHSVFPADRCRSLGTMQEYSVFSAHLLRLGIASCGLIS